MLEHGYIVLIIAGSIGLTAASKLFPRLLYLGLFFILAALLVLLGLSKTSAFLVLLFVAVVATISFFAMKAKK